MTAKSVMTLHEALNFLGKTYYPEDWQKGDQSGYLTNIDTSDLDNSKRPHKPKVRRQSERGRFVVGKFFHLAREHKIHPFIIVGKTKSYIDVDAFGSPSIRKLLVATGKIEESSSLSHLVGSGEVFVLREEISKILKPEGEEFMTSQQLSAGAKVKFDYGKISALAMAVDVEEGPFQSKTKHAERVIAVWQHMWPKEDPPSVDTIKKRVLDDYFALKSRVADILKNEL